MTLRTGIVNKNSTLSDIIATIFICKNTYYAKNHCRRYDTQASQSGARNIGNVTGIRKLSHSLSHHGAMVVRTMGKLYLVFYFLLWISIAFCISDLDDIQNACKARCQSNLVSNDNLFHY